MACDPQTIITDAKAFGGQSEPRLLGMMVYLLGQWLKQLNPSADVTPQALSNAAECYTCGLTWKGLYGAMVYLLCLIEAQGGGGGGGGFPLATGSGSPQGVVTPAGIGQRYFDTTGGVFYTNTDGTVNGWRVG